MSRQFWTFLAVGLVIVAGAVALIWSGTKGAHLELNGKIINVRSIALDNGMQLVAVDFRVSNPSDIPFVLREVSMTLETAGQPLKGLEVSRGDVDTMFRNHPLLGGRDNDVLATGDTIAGGKSLYRMAEASFETTAAALRSRNGLTIHMEDVDGAEFDLSEAEAEKQAEDKK